MNGLLVNVDQKQRAISISCKLSVYNHCELSNLTSPKLNTTFKQMYVLESTHLQGTLHYDLVVRESNLIQDMFSVTEENVLCISLRLFTDCEKSFTLVRKKTLEGKVTKI
jgi:hypothetical protein